MRRRALLLVLALLAAFEAGVLFDRWLHRPIRVAGMTFELTGDSPDTPPPSKCFTDGAIPCAAPGRETFKLRPITGPCFFDPLVNQACQQET